MTFVERTWRSGRRYQAFVASSISDTAIRLPTDAMMKCDRATADLARIGSRAPLAWEPLGRLMLRAEGLASSDIEGIRVSADRLLGVAETGATDREAQLVLSNIEAIERAYLDARHPLSKDLLLEWHAILMAESSLPREYVGVFRDVQGWIGGLDPTSAVFVPAPPETIDGLVDDLVGFANRHDLNPVCQAAVLHAQFETIHPFADGNGRVGRALVGWCLGRRGILDRVMPPISPILARQPDRYVHGLWMYREGQVEAWVEWFADVCLAAVQLVEDTATAIAGLQRRWRAQLSDLRADSSALNLVDHLPSSPLIDVKRAAAALRVSETTARQTLETLEDRGILTTIQPAPVGRGRPRRLWLARGITDLM